ncbi:MAG: hypothetical protein ABI091_26510 [Ferruginibacter sp.]
MKTITLSVLLLICSLNSFCQNDSAFLSLNTDTSFGTSISWGLQEGNTNVNFSDDDSTGTIQINGDTMSAIRLLIKSYKDIVRQNNENYRFISAAVDFSNEVPDYYRTKLHNCMWPAFYKELRKNGFHQIDKPKKYKDPCCKVK